MLEGFGLSEGGLADREHWRCVVALALPDVTGVAPFRPETAPGRDSMALRRKCATDAKAAPCGAVAVKRWQVTKPAAPSGRLAFPLVSGSMFVLAARDVCANARRHQLSDERWTYPGPYLCRTKFSLRCSLVRRIFHYRRSEQYCKSEGLALHWVGGQEGVDGVGCPFDPGLGLGDREGGRGIFVGQQSPLMQVEEDVSECSDRLGVA